MNITKELSEKIKNAIGEFTQFYLNTCRPIVICFSGGKDSTCCLQLVIMALKNLPKELLKNRVYVTFSDTLVEPLPLSNYLRDTLVAIEEGVRALELPIEVIALRPSMNDTFFVNMIGRGYKAPTMMFRWCTERMKIRPINGFIESQVEQNGEVYLIIGARTEESIARARSLKAHTIEGKIKKHATLKGALTFALIEEWTTEDVWSFLTNFESPYGTDNRILEKLYEDSTSTNTDHVYNKTRHGCWVCTVIKNDRSLEAFCENGYNLKPLLEFRNHIQSMSGDVTCTEEIRRKGTLAKSLLTTNKRADLLRRLLIAQKEVGQQLICQEELNFIDSIWKEDKSKFCVADVINSLEKNIPLIEQMNMPCIHFSQKELTKEIGTIEDVFNDIWERDTYVTVLYHAKGKSSIIKGYGEYVLLNGKEEWALRHKEEFAYDIQQHSITKEFLSTFFPELIKNSLSEDINEREDYNFYNSKMLLDSVSLFDNSYWDISKEPDGMIYVTYGVYQPSFDFKGETYYKPLGREKGTDITSVMLKAREEFISNETVFKAIDKFKASFSDDVNDTKFIDIERDKLTYIAQSGQLMTFLMHLNEIKGADFIKFLFDNSDMNKKNKNMMKMLVLMHGGFCKVYRNKNRMSWIIIPKHNLKMFALVSLACCDYSNIVDIIPIKCRYKYNTELIKKYNEEEKRCVHEYRVREIEIQREEKKKFDKSVINERVGTYLEYSNYEQLQLI
jgi:DNA sulfur modification protein DndC